MVGMPTALRVCETEQGAFIENGRHVMRSNVK